jgi:pSer/pThr/pTyr-binding forkhead associated (FHA) protein/S1-C subfamily serine protease
VLLRDDRRDADLRVPETGARLGRDPDCEIAFPEDDAVVSAFHCRIERREDGTWWVEDLGSTNGTWLDGARVTGPTRLTSGQRLSLGQRGPALTVRIPGELPPTRAEPALDPGAPALRLRRVAGGQDLIAGGRHVVIGRAAGCTIALRTTADTVVSKHHAVVEIDDEGRATISDLGSRNGTFVNGEPISGRTLLAPGDRIMLGWTGPLFEVRTIAGSSMSESDGAPYRPERQPPKTFGGMVISAGEAARESRRARAAVFLQAMARQMVRESSTLFRAAVLVLMAGLIATVALAYRSLTRQAAAAQARLEHTERALIEQQRASEAARTRAEAETRRLRAELAAARASAVSRSVLDSLERRLREAEARGLAPAVSGTVSVPDFARVARDNQRAVGLVVVQFPNGDSVMGSGFAITRSGYFVSNRHVVADQGRGTPRIEVIMADDNVPQPAEVAVVSSAQDQDIAILRIRNFRGHPVRAVDWWGRGAHQGDPAAMIGFPRGTQLAFADGRVVRTSIFAGIISQTAGEWIRFGGTTFNGVSGSPVFNANGEVIAVHFGVLRDGPGLGFSVPMSRVRRWLPPEARAELGL